MGIIEYRIMASNELKPIKLIIFTEFKNIKWLQYIMDEFCRIEKAIFSIIIKVYDNRLERNQESLYYLSESESDIFQCPNYDLHYGSKLKIIDLKKFQILDGTISHFKYWLDYDLLWNAFFYLSRLSEYQLSQNGFYTRGYSFRTKMPDNFRWDIPHVNFLFKEFKSKLKSKFPFLKFKKEVKAILELSHDLDYIKAL